MIDDEKYLVIEHGFIFDSLHVNFTPGCDEPTNPFVEPRSLLRDGLVAVARCPVGFLVDEFVRSFMYDEFVRSFM